MKRALPVLLVLLLAAPLLAGADPRADAKDLVPLAEEVAAAIDSGTDARARWDAFEERWLAVEDPIRALSPELYRKIEERMQEVSGALPRKGPCRAADAKAALAGLETVCRAVAALPAGTPTPSGTISIEEFLREAARAQTLAAADPVAAFGCANEAWFQVEGSVRDRSAYRSCEAALAEARAASKRGDGPAVATAIGRVRTTVEPLARKEGHVGALDAALILLREGAEALVVLAAIAAFLGRLGAPEKARTVWAGGALGLGASLLGGALLVRVFAGVAAGERREAVEGFSSLVAAALLVLVGQWLHEKIRRGGWKRQVQSALESGKTVSLLLVAFFAVFREGAETVVFIAGLAPASTPRELLLGVALGLATLAVLGALLLRLGKRVRLGPFLSFATVLLWALAVKFAGGGVESLQAGGIVPATRFAALPDVPLLGFSPTLESTGAQLLVLLLWAGFAIWPRCTPLLRGTKLSSIKA